MKGKGYEKSVFSFLLIWSSCVLSATGDQLLGKYDLHESHQTVTGVGFGYEYTINIYKDKNGVYAEYQASGRGVAIDYICDVTIDSKKVVLTFSRYGKDAEEYGYKDGSKAGDHVLTLIPGTKGNEVYLEVDGELGEMYRPKFYKH